MKQRRHTAYTRMAFFLLFLLSVLLWGFQGLLVLHGSSSALLVQIGLQRSRVERMTKDALLITNGSPPSILSQAVSEVQNILPNWIKTQTGLQVGDASLGLPTHPPSDILLLVIQAQPSFQAITTAMQHVLANPTDTSIAATVQLQIILDHENTYYNLMSQVNLLWQQRIDDFFWHLFWIETGLVAGIVLAALWLAVEQWRRSRWIARQASEGDER